MSDCNSYNSNGNGSSKGHHYDSSTTNNIYQTSIKVQQNTLNVIKKQHLITVSVVGLSGPSYFKGISGVGKSCLCNRFCRQNYDDYSSEHASILSQADFCGSPVINNDHWLWWGDIPLDPLITDSLKMKTTHIRVIEQTEFLSDETYNSITHKASHEQKNLNDYLQRSARVKMESQGKLMYISTDQLGQEDDYPKVELTDGKITVDAFIVVLDPVHTKDRNIKFTSLFTIELVKVLHKTKKPIFFAATKCDIADEGYLESLQSIFNNKEWKISPIYCVETSAHNNVNVKELFYYIAHQLERNKNKFKLNCYDEGLALQRRREEEVRKNFKTLLESCIPVKNYKQIDNIPWIELYNKLSDKPHSNFTTFVNFFGSRETIKYFKSYLDNLKEEWMNCCLINHLPSLKIVLVSLLNKSNIPYMMWDDAKKIIMKHPLFLQHFKETSLDDTLTKTEEEEIMEKTKIPIELLHTSQAQKTFTDYQREIELDRKEKQREFEFIQFLKECKQITPGKTFNDALIFLKGYLPFEQIIESKAIKIYEEYQFKLIQMAEKNFQELLLEHVETFYKMFNDKKDGKRYIKRSFKHSWFCDEDYKQISAILVDDIRYRQLNILHDLRRKMIEKYAMYIGCEMQISNSCPCGFKCTDAIVMELLDQHLQKVKEINSNIPTNIEIVIYGEESLAEDFISSMQEVSNRMGYNTPNKKSSITFTYTLYSENYKTKIRNDSSKISIYLLSCKDIFEKFIPLIENEVIYSEMPPVLIEPPAMTERNLRSFAHDNNLSKTIENFAKQYNLSVISCDTKYDYQLDNFVADTVNRHLSGKTADVKINLLVMCQDQNPINRILEPIFPFLSNNLYSLSSGCLTFDIPIYDSINNPHRITNTSPLDSLNNLRVDIRAYSYHSWLTFNNGRYHNNTGNSQGHILTYQANRMASFEHMKVALSNLINCERHNSKQSKKSSSAGSCIMINALAGLEDYFQNKETNRMLTEGNQLAANCGALFQNNLQSCSNETEKARLINFFKNVYEISQTDALASSTINISDTESNSSGFASTTINSNGSKASSSSSASNTPSSNYLRSPKSSRCPSQQSNFTQYSTSSPLQGAKNSPIFDHKINTPSPNNLTLITPPHISSLLNMGMNAPLATPEDNPELSEDLIYIHELYNSIDYDKKNNDIMKPAPFPTALSNISLAENSSNNGNDKKKGSSNVHNEFEFERPEVYKYNINVTRNRRMDGKSYYMRSLSVDNELENEDPVYEFLDFKAVRKEREGNMNGSISPTGGSDGIVSRDTTMKRRDEVNNMTLYQSFDNLLFSVDKDMCKGEKKSRKFHWNKIPLLRFMSQVKVTKSSPTTPVSMNRNKAKSLADVESPTEGVIERFALSVRKGLSRRKSKCDDSFTLSDKLINTDKLSNSVDFDRITINSKSSSHLTTSSTDSTEHDKLQCLPIYLAENKDGSTTKFFRFGKKDKKNGGKKNGAPQKPPLKQPNISTKTLIELSMEDPSERIPLFMKKCIQFLEKDENIKTEGIYRVSGSQAGSQILEKKFKIEGVFEPELLDLPVHTVASSLKSFFSNLQEPLIPEYLHADIIDCTKMYLGDFSTKNMNDPSLDLFKKKLTDVFKKMPPINKHVLRNLSIHIQRVAEQCAYNSMNLNNMAKVWWPTLFRPDMESFLQVNQTGPFLESATFWTIKLGKEICIPTVD
uniref:G domain-containing protein n=1 Tax=Parastrongyloides trichosuri TaxID=131310 RepID=A0A0N4ZBY7_PARTI